MHRTIRRCLALISVVMLATFAGGTSISRASDSPPRLRHDIGAFSIYGHASVNWDGASAMPLRGAVGSENVVEFSSRTDASGSESYVASPSVVARDASHLHHVFASAFDAAADVTVDHVPGPLDGPVVADVDLPRVPSFACGGADMTIDSSNSPFTLKPGSYGVVTVMQDQVLRLVAGARYELCSLRVRPGATVEAHSGTFVLLRDYLSTGARARITGDGACGARWIALAASTSPAPASAGFEFAQGSGSGNRARIEGQFYTPGRITMAQHNDYVGRFWADRVDGFGAEQVTRTLADCRASECGDGIVDEGEACDDGNNREGDCCTSFCEVADAGAACDDGLFCTRIDTCDANAHCGGDGDPCDAPDGDANCSESCNEETDACNGADPDAVPCDDGVWCNGADLCAGGQCVAHSGPPCPGPDDDANCRESCDENAHACDVADAAGAPCNDGRFCTRGEVCDGAGACGGGASPCPGSDGDDNCAEACDELADSCTAFDPDGTACDDGLFCTASDTCDGRGRCRGWGDPCAASVDDGDANCSESCDEESATCSAADPNGSPCSDGLSCTVGERCVGGSCAPSGQTTCDDSNPCTDEFCAPDGSCVREWNFAPCDDGNACTSNDRCSRGVCEGDSAVDCRDDDLCSSDVCDPADGSCHHSYSPAGGCHALGTSTTRIELGYSPKDGEVAESMTTSWKGSHGVDPSAREELGDPSSGDPFAVCFYDESGGLPVLAYRLDLAPSTLGGATWTRSWRASDVSYKLKAANGTAQGVSQVRLGIDKTGSPTFKLKAGANSGCTSDCRAKFDPPRPRPDGRLFAMEPGLTVQWVAATGACWSARYERAAINTGDSFHARARP